MWNAEYGRTNADTRTSLKLIRGTLDQVAATVDISWVQPRVLEESQLETLATQFKAWTNAVGRTQQDVESLRRQAQAVTVA
jgi:26S proteasome regulatory subunit N9